MPDKLLHHFEVSLQEVDHAGVMFFAHLFSRAHDAYAELMCSIGFALHRIIESGDYHIPLVHAETDYMAPLRHGDRVAISLTVISLGNTSFTLDYQFEVNNRLCAKTSTRHVCIDPDTQKPMPIPEPLRNKLAELLTA